MKYLCLIVMLSLACQGGGQILGTIDGAVVVSPSGNLPPALPHRLLIGLNADTGETWPKESGVPWDLRATYLAKGWVNNFGFGAADGSVATTYLTESAGQAIIPALTFGQLDGEAGGTLLAKTQNATTMASYFSDFKLLMKLAKDFGKPVLVFVENDSFGVLEIAANHDPNQPAAVASSGLAELAGLPNTLAGWGQAFPRLRKAVGATNVTLSIDVSAYTSGYDLLFANTDVAIEPEVDKAMAYLGPSGIVANTSGESFDVLAHRMQEFDCDYSRIVNGENRCFDPTETASMYSLSYNRLVEWLRLWNQKAGKRWVLWNLSLGNRNHKNVANTGGPSEGYQDNKVEYFFGDAGPAHRARFVAAGVVGLLFGPLGETQASYKNDVFTDGQLLFKTRAGAFLQAGGLALK